VTVSLRISLFSAKSFWSLNLKVLVSSLIWLASPTLAADRPVIVCYGDSISAGYGVASGQSYPDDLQRHLDSSGYRYKVVNMGTSGATTKDAVAHLPEVLGARPAIVIVEFGGNDGLRGLRVDDTRKNLNTVLSTLQNAHIRVLLAGITLPPNYGPDYVKAFNDVFRQVDADQHPAAFVPMIYKDLVHIPGTIQEDGIHPTAKGAEILADTLERSLTPLLRK
jgi:acyl-CoA thioesterase I